MAAILDAILNASVCPAQTLPGPDNDHDGLPNSYEQQMGTNPENPDTNGNGINDGQNRGFSRRPRLSKL